MTMTPTTLHMIGTALFAMALVHTFSTAYFERLAHASPRHAGAWHLLGEVEVHADYEVTEVMDEVKKGGIIIPDSAKEKPMQGQVLAVGNGRVLEDGTKLALDVKEGDKVLFGKYSGTEIRIDGEEVLIVREDEVLAVLG